MKNFILGILLCSGFTGFSQYDSRFGLTVGVNQYYMKSNFLSSRSAMGYSGGAVSTLPISEYSEILVEGTVARFKSELLGRESVEATQQEWIEFNLDRINISVIYDYDILHFFNEDLAIGLNAGPSLAASQDWRVDDDAKRDYIIEPYAVDSDYLRMDTYNGKVSMNVFIAMGLSVRYRDLEANFRYFKGVTDPYRNIPLSSPFLELKGKDNYSAFTLTYYFGDNF